VPRDAAAAVRADGSRGQRAAHRVRLGGNGAWAEGDGATLAAALGAASCVVAELDVGGSGLGADEALALVAAGRALQTLRLGEWASCDRGERRCRRAARLWATPMAPS
jgi:hypothetical protein